MIAAVELVQNRASKTPFPAEAAMQARLSQYLMDEGVFLRVWDVIHVAPPLISKRADIDRVIDGLDRAIGRFEADVGIGLN
jgi:putrescine aminotransferase